MPVKIFFCYAHEDEPLLNKLKKHLRLLQWQGLIEAWHDRDISAGTEWEQEISEHLNDAQIILLLVSPDFMNSNYSYGIEMKRAIERHERREARVIPVILRYVNWQEAPFGKLHAQPTNAKPVKSWHDMDKAFFDVAEGVRKVIEELAVPKEKRDKFEKFSERARRILHFSEEEALRLRHLYIGTEHLLLGLLREGQIIMHGHRSMALSVLERLGIKPNKVSSEIEFLVGTGSPSLRVVIELTLGAKRVVEFAVDEARHMGNHYVRSEHLLLGLLREADSIAARVLEGFGIGLEETRGEVVRTNNTLQNLTWELR